MKADTLIKELKTKETVFGARVALKKLRSKDVEKIYLSKDCPEKIMKRLEKEKFTNVIKTELTKEEVRELCKKDFNISVIAILKEKTGKKTKKKVEIK